MSHTKPKSAPIRTRLPLGTRRALEAHLRVHGRLTDAELKDLRGAADAVEPAGRPGRLTLCFRAIREVIAGARRRLHLA